MPRSQLKQLKASLRDNGILGPQQSKKSRRSNNKDASKRLQRNAALKDIRERFNPFEAKAPARREKFDIASNQPTKRTIERPGVTRGLGEERRRETLLKEMQSRNKVGGMLDRRFGEDDPNMTPEQKAAERFAQQATRQSRKGGIFNLEEDSDEEVMLTHGGRALRLNMEEKQVSNHLRDDFDEDVSASDAEDFDAQDDRPRKRVRIEDGDGEDEDRDKEQQSERKKMKKEVMQEVIAKSKAYKAARQAAKEDDDDLRLELDKGMGDMFQALQSQKRPQPKQLPSPDATDSEPSMNPSRAAMLAGKSREEAEKEYEANVRQMKLDARSKPSVRTKSDEEKAVEEKARLEELERKRIRRMKGEPDSSDEEEDPEEGGAEVDVNGDVDDAQAFGLYQPEPVDESEPQHVPRLEVEDEDEFVMDNIVATDSEADAASDFEDDSSTLQEPEDDGDDDFINGLVLPAQPATVKKTDLAPHTSNKPTAVPYTFPCPQDLSGMEQATHDIADDELPTVVQRIRALYHKGLAAENELKLGHFAQTLIPWLAHLVNHDGEHYPSMRIIEQIIRHIHSMAKAQPLEIASAFREYLRGLAALEKPELDAGDLTVLTSILTIFPTSDRWHSVVTPAMLVLARYLGQAQMESFTDLVTGTYACSLALNFQARSERYVPEVITFISKAIQLLVPGRSPVSVPPYTTPKPLDTLSYRITKKSATEPLSCLSFEELRSLHTSSTPEPHTITSESLLLTLLKLLMPLITQHALKSAYPQLISPIQSLLSTFPTTQLHPTTTTFLVALNKTLTETTTHLTSTRRPLLLHNHRSLAIKSSYPAFTDNHNPTRRQQDPDCERAELNKLRAEHKKERKGAMRELRKDANFMAREQLKDKKVKDEAYERKFKRLVAEIQGEEGREAKSYDRERERRRAK